MLRWTKISPGLIKEDSASQRRWRRRLGDWQNSLGTHNDGLGDARVGAANPEQLWTLPLGALPEEVWLVFLDVLGPLDVGGDHAREGWVGRGHWWGRAGAIATSRGEVERGPI